jgi:hypothetical protein
MLIAPSLFPLLNNIHMQSNQHLWSLMLNADGQDLQSDEFHSQDSAPEPTRGEVEKQYGLSWWDRFLVIPLCGRFQVPSATDE